MKRHREPEVKRVKIGRIRDSAVHWERKYSDKDIASMSASFDMVGQEHPITVRPNPENPKYLQIVDGGLRWKTARHRNDRTILASIHHNMSDVDAELTSITCNISRMSVTPFERDAMTARVRELLLKRSGGKKAKRGGQQKLLPETNVARSHSPEPEAEEPPVSDGDVAAVTGRDRSTEAKSRKRWENLITLAMNNYKAKRITQKQADELAGMDPEDQPERMHAMIAQNLHNKHKDLEEEREEEEMQAIKDNAPTEARNLLYKIEAACQKSVEPLLDQLLRVAKEDDEVRHALSKAKPVSLFRTHNMFETLVELTGMPEGR